MEKTAVIFLANGFEEIEALGTSDVLIRNGIQVVLTGLNGTDVVGAHGIKVNATADMSSVPHDADAYILPGGLPGATNLRDCDVLCRLMKQVYAQGAICAAICAAPIALHTFGLLNDKRVTGYPGCEKLSKQDGLTFSGKMVEVDGQIITGKGPGASFEFATAIAQALGVPEAKTQSVLEGMFAVL